MEMTLPMPVVPVTPEPLTHGYLLIEPATLDHAPELEMLAMHPCTPRVLAHREELMPRLLDVSALDESARAVVTELWLSETDPERPPIACAWLESELDGAALAQHIARYLVGPGVDGNPVFWRYYDPRVLSLTLAVFDPVQRQALIGPIKTWQFAWAGHHWSMSGPGIVADPLDQHAPAWPRPEQWPRVERSDVAARVLNRLPAMAVEDAARLPVELDRIFCDVARHGLAQIDDLADYAWHCVKYGQAFEQHPTIVGAWPAFAGKQVTWPDIVARLTPEDIQQFEQISRSPKA
jgi:hypothetical protein